MKKLPLLILLLLSARVQAQTPLPVPIVCHGCPDRATYRTLEEIPFLSAQGHWSGDGVNLFGNVIDVLGFNPNHTIYSAAHVHAECGKPAHLAPPGTTSYALYGEYSGPMHFDCQLVLRDVKGRVGIYTAVSYHTEGNNWYHVVWEDTGSAQQPLMVGDFFAPMGVQTYKFHFDINPRPNFHGFDSIAIGVHVGFDTGDALDISPLFPYWTNTTGDPTAPVTVGTEGPNDVPLLGIIVTPNVNPARKATDTFGDTLTLIWNYVPTAPLAGRWSVPLNHKETAHPFPVGPVLATNSYGQTVPSVDGSCQVRRDQNFHMEDLSNLGPDGTPVMLGIYGVETSRVDRPQAFGCQIVIDNTGLPAGDHTYAFARYQPENTIPENGVASLMVIHVPVPADGSDPVPLPEPVPTPTPIPTPTPVPTPVPTPTPVLPTIVSVLTCQTVTMSDGSVTSQCVHVP